MIAAMRATSRTAAAISSSDRELTDRSWPPTGGQPLPARSGTLMEMNVRPQSAVLKMIRQQHDAIGIVAGRFQRIDVAQDFVILQIDHGNGSIAHAFQIEKAILNEQVPLVGRARYDERRVLRQWL